MGPQWSNNSRVDVNRTPVSIAVGVLSLFFQASGAGPIQKILWHPVDQTLVWHDHRQIRHQASPKDAASTRVAETSMMRIRDLAFDSTGERLAIAGGQPGEWGEIEILQWPSGERLFHTQRDDDWFTVVAFNPQNDGLVTGGADARISIWKPHIGQSILHREHTWQAHSDSIMEIVWDASGSWLLSAGADHAIKCWEAQTWALQRGFNEHTGMVHALALRPGRKDGSSKNPPMEMASASADQSIRIWQPIRGRMVRIVRPSKNRFLCVSYHPSGRWLAAAGEGGEIHLLDADSDQEIHTLQTDQAPVFTLSFSPNGKWLAAGDDSGRVRSYPFSGEWP